MDKAATLIILACSTVTIMAPICFSLKLAGGNTDQHKYNLAQKNQNGNSLLKCDHGMIQGGLELFEFIENVNAECNGPPLERPYVSDSTIAEYYNCLTKITGMTEADGTPNIKNIDTVNTKLYSEEILNNIPSFKENLHSCAVEYETNFNQIDKPQETAAERYFKCFGNAARNAMYAVGGDFDKVCSSVQKEKDSIRERVEVLSMI